MIEFLPLKKINAQYSAQMHQKLDQVLESGWYIGGDEVSGFENEFADFVGSQFCIGTSNGLDALVLILRALMECKKLRPGDRVAVPSNTFIATVNAIILSGLTPVLVEPDEETLNITSTSLKHCDVELRACIGVHLYGRMFDESLVSYCEEQSIILIEDAAQAHGASYNKKRVGTLGVAAAFSFYPGKNLGALGDGGCVTTDDSDLANIVRKLGNYGSSQKYHHDLCGGNNRLDALQAAFLRIKLPLLAKSTERRVCIARQYMQSIHNPLIRLPAPPMGDLHHVYHLFVVRASRRNELAQALSRAGIATAIHYPVPPHRQEFLKREGVEYSVASKVSETCLSLPCNEAMTDDEVRAVISAINAFV